MRKRSKKIQGSGTDSLSRGSTESRNRSVTGCKKATCFYVGAGWEKKYGARAASFQILGLYLPLLVLGEPAEIVLFHGVGLCRSMTDPFSVISGNTALPASVINPSCIRLPLFVQCFPVAFRFSGT